MKKEPKKEKKKKKKKKQGVTQLYNWRQIQGCLPRYTQL